MFVLYCVTMPFTMREGANKNGRPGRPDNAVSNTNDVAIGAVRRLATAATATDVNDGAAAGWDTQRNGSANRRAGARRRLAERINE